MIQKTVLIFIAFFSIFILTCMPIDEVWATFTESEEMKAEESTVQYLKFVPQQETPGDVVVHQMQFD